jgi:DNA processing protein
MITLTDRQRLDWLRLIRCEGVGPVTFRTLLNRFGGAAAAVEALPALARQAGRTVTVPSLDEIEREVERAGRLGVRFLALGEQGYPTALAATDSAPPVLAVRGRIQALSRPMIALVGSRNASALGLKFTQVLARAFNEAGLVVVSGLARGIDTAAHEASVEGGTVAVLAGGHGQIYPPQNVPLLERLVEHGAAVSEMPFSLEPRARDFPRRNRIVAGLCRAVVVVEAARKSGSLITARLALEQGREVFAVPGSPLDPRAEGANDLIHAGQARLCRSADDVVNELQPQIEVQAALFEPMPHDMSRERETGLLDELDWLLATDVAHSESMPVNALALSADAGEAEILDDQTPGDASQRLLALLGASPLSLDDLSRLSGHSVREIGSLLVEMEMDGRARRDASGGFVRAL